MWVLCESYIPNQAGNLSISTRLAESANTDWTVERFNFEPALWKVNIKLTWRLLCAGDFGALHYWSSQGRPHSLVLHSTVPQSGVSRPRNTPLYHWRIQVSVCVLLVSAVNSPLPVIAGRIIIVVCLVWKSDVFPFIVKEKVWENMNLNRLFCLQVVILLC